MNPFVKIAKSGKARLVFCKTCKGKGWIITAPGHTGTCPACSGWTKSYRIFPHVTIFCKTCWKSAIRSLLQKARNAPAAGS